MFEKIVGYDYVKEELETIINRYSNPELLENENANLPSGILFWGSPGNGKTLFIKGLKERFKDNAFVIDGGCENTKKELIEHGNMLFEKGYLVKEDYIDYETRSN